MNDMSNFNYFSLNIDSGLGIKERDRGYINTPITKRKKCADNRAKEQSQRQVQIDPINKINYCRSRSSKYHNLSPKADIA